MPFKNRQQQKKCYALKARGKNGTWNCDEWSHSTKQFGGGEDGIAEGDSNFLNTLYQLGTQQEEQNQEEDLDPNNYLLKSEKEQNYPEYDDLQEQIEDLRSQIINRSSEGYDPMFNNSHQSDDMLSFLFQDERDNDPILFPETNSRESSNSKANTGFRSFNSYQEGRAALENQLQLYQTGKTKNPVKPDSSLYEAMSVYAPVADRNNPKHYAEFIAKRLGISANTPISKINTKDWASAIEKMEGNKKGNNPGNLRPYQAGGEANTPEELHEGLNNPAFETMILNLPDFTNEIRGLDSGEAIQIFNDRGQQRVLKGADDTVKMKGRKIYELKL